MFLAGISLKILAAIAGVVVIAWGSTTAILATNQFAKQSCPKCEEKDQSVQQSKQSLSPYLKKEKEEEEWRKKDFELLFEKTAPETLTRKDFSKVFKSWNEKNRSMQRTLTGYQRFMRHIEWPVLKQWLEYGHHSEPWTDKWQYHRWRAKNKFKNVCFLTIPLGDKYGGISYYHMPFAQYFFPKNATQTPGISLSYKKPRIQSIVGPDFPGARNQNRPEYEDAAEYLHDLYDEILSHIKSYPHIEDIWSPDRLIHAPFTWSYNSNSCSKFENQLKMKPVF